MKSFYITTLGCKVNQYESDAIAARLEGLGWKRLSLSAGADLLIINTCTVTGNASTQSRHAIRQLVRENGDATLIVTGCYAQTEADVISAIDGVDHVIGHTDKHRIPDLIAQAADGSPLPFPTCHGEDRCKETVFRDFEAPATSGDRTRPFLKIQDGCNSFCTYCIVPYTRGRSRSLPFDAVVKKVNALSEAGFRETVITGIHVGMYGHDLSPAMTFTDALARLSEGDGPRLRMGSVEPKEVDDALIDLVAENPRMCAHFHMPLQNGDDTILSRMHRPYDTAFYLERATRIRKTLPHAAIGADVLLGFPGETDAQFENTCRLVDASPLTYLHVFPYSARPGTPAASYPDPVPGDVAKKRCAILREIGEKKRHAFAASLVGEPLDVLVEHGRDRKTEKLKGISGNYQTVLLDGDDGLANTIVRVTIDSVDEGGQLHGTLA